MRFTVNRKNFSDLNCTQIFELCKGESSIADTLYMDPLGFEYPKSIVACHKCMFNLGYESCVLLKEQGVGDELIMQHTSRVSLRNECDHFLIRNYSESNINYGEDDDAHERVKAIAQKLNYPEPYWLMAQAQASEEDVYGGSGAADLDWRDEYEPEEPVDEDDWLSVDEDKFWEAVNKVEREQSRHGVETTESKLQNCSECGHVRRDSSRSHGSPTGLLCTHKNISVTAKGMCDKFSDELAEEESMKGLGTEWCFLADGLVPSGTCPKGGQHEWELRIKAHDTYKGSPVYRQHCIKCYALGMNVFEK